MTPRRPKGYPRAWLDHPALTKSPAWQSACAADRHLHLAACCILGYAQPAPFDYILYQLYYGFAQAGYTVTDLVDVLTWRLTENAKPGAGMRYSTRLTTVLGDLAAFADDLHRARKPARPRTAPTEPVEIVQILPGGGERRVEGAPTTPEPAAVDDASIAAALAPLREWRESRKRPPRDCDA